MNTSSGMLLILLLTVKLSRPEVSICSPDQWSIVDVISCTGGTWPTSSNPPILDPNVNLDKLTLSSLTLLTTTSYQLLPKLEIRILEFYDLNIVNSVGHQVAFPFKDFTRNLLKEMVNQLTFQDVPLYALTDTDFEGLSRLQRLSISGCSLSEIHPDSFRHFAVPMSGAEDFEYDTQFTSLYVANDWDLQSFPWDSLYPFRKSLESLEFRELYALKSIVPGRDGMTLNKLHYFTTRYCGLDHLSHDIVNTLQMVKIGWNEERFNVVFEYNQNLCRPPNKLAPLIDWASEVVDEARYLMASCRYHEETVMEQGGPDTWQSCTSMVCLASPHCVRRQLTHRPDRLVPAEGGQPQADPSLNFPHPNIDNLLITSLTIDITAKRHQPLPTIEVSSLEFRDIEVRDWDSHPSAAKPSFPFKALIRNVVRDKVDYVSFRDIPLYAVADTDFEGFSGLRSLVLSGCSLKEISPRSFSHFATGQLDQGNYASHFEKLQIEHDSAVRSFDWELLRPFKNSLKSLDLNNLGYFRELTSPKAGLILNVLEDLHIYRTAVQTTISQEIVDTFKSSSTKPSKDTVNVEFRANVNRCRQPNELTPLIRWVINATEQKRYLYASCDTDSHEIRGAGEADFWRSCVTQSPICTGVEDPVTVSPTSTSQGSTAASDPPTAHTTRRSASDVTTSKRGSTRTHTTGNRPWTIHPRTPPLRPHNNGGFCWKNSAGDSFLQLIGFILLLVRL